MDNPKIEDLVGKTFSSVINNNDTEIIFTLKNGDKYIFYHERDCCEIVSVQDIIGDLNDLIDTPILSAEEVYNDEFVNNWNESSDSFTWTFYKFKSRKGYVDIRWLGESNGYYSESVDLKFEKKD